MSQLDILNNESIQSTSTEYNNLDCNEGLQLASNKENDLNALNISDSARSPEKVPKLITDNLNVNKNLLDEVQDINPLESVNKNYEQSSTNKKFKRINFEDSEEEFDKNNDFSEESKVDKDKFSDNDSEDIQKPLLDDDSNTVQSEHTDEVQIKKKPKKFVLDSESEDELSGQVEENVIQQESQSLMPRLGNLVDPESSEDECEADNYVLGSIKQQTELFKPGKSATNEKNPKVKKMTAKDALKQRHEIKSESQRMLRESPVSLPYHKPKERSIKEFLKNRPRLSILKSVHNVPASAAIKMTKEELQVATKKMEEREKQLEKFYESESESEEELSKEDGESVNENCTEIVTQCEAVSPTKDNEFALSEINEDNNIINKSSPSKSSPAKLAEEENVEVDISVDIPILGDEENINCDDNFDQSPTEETEPMETNADEVHIPEIENNQNCDTIEENKSENVDYIIPEDNSNKENKIIIHSVVTIPKQSIYTLEESMDFDFNLDGIDDIPDSNKTKSKKEVFGNDDDNANADFLSVANTSKQDVLRQQLGDYTPCLSGDPDHEIDLDEGVVKPSAVIQLMERFKKHVEVQSVPKSKIKFDIINLSQGILHNETVVVPADDKEEPVNATDKPKLRNQKLRNDLQERIAQERAELWKQKQQAFDELTKTNDEKSETKSDYEDNILDNDEEEELTDDNDTDYEEDVDYCDLQGEKTSKVKSAFIDEEAEESDDDEVADNDGMEADDESAENDDSSCDFKSVAQDSNADTSQLTSQPEPKKTLKRIIKAFTEDSDEEEENVNTAVTKSWDDDDDNNIPPYQPRPDKTPHKESTQSKSDITFHTPITQLSALQGLNSGSKFLHESPISPFSFPQPSPAGDTPTVKQKLFADSCDAFQPEVTTQELIGLCSGEFSNTNTEEESDPLKKSQLCTQNLLSICSGSFTGLSNQNSHSDAGRSLAETDSVHIKDANYENATDSIANTNSQSKYLDEDRLISQLLNEDELESFKKKFESPVANTSNTSNIINDSKSETKGGGRLVFDSSDDECAESDPKIKQNKHKKLDYSDDESEDDEEAAEDDEEIDLYDDDSAIDDNTNKVIDYDSEENEIDVQTEYYKPSEFVDKEAELSESDWDSADEDEKGLDVLEKEQGDDEVFDENKIRSDLEKIHMRNVLDQDNREIKILQELLLEDGELHGTGRQRQFKWRNIDDNANDDKGPVDGDEVYLDEDESEEQWRKLRHQREMFLKSQDKQVDDGDDSILSDSNSQVLKFGQEVLRRSLSNCSAPSDKEKINCSSTSAETLKKSSILMNTRGSFLSRSNNFLTRLADITKVNNTTSLIKTSTKIVFQTSTLDEENSTNSKRKADDGTPIAIKKLRLSSNISPSLKGVERKKKLF